MYSIHRIPLRSNPRHSLLKCLLPLALMVAVILLSSCRHGENPDHERSRKAAEKAYQLLINGKYDDFVQQIYYADSLTDTYRRQLADRMAEYMQTESDRRGGIVSAIATYDTLFNTSDSLFPLQAHVFLELTFGDGSQHEVGVPMVKVGKHWRLQ